MEIYNRNVVLLSIIIRTTKALHRSLTDFTLNILGFILNKECWNYWGLFTLYYFLELSRLEFCNYYSLNYENCNVGPMLNERPETITTEEEKEKPDRAFKGHERLLMKKSIKRIADAQEVSMELLSHSIQKTERVYKKKTAHGNYFGLYLFIINC